MKGKIEKVLILVEINGVAYQVLGEHERKRACVDLLCAKNGALPLSAPLKPVILEKLGKISKPRMN